MLCNNVSRISNRKENEQNTPRIGNYTYPKGFLKLAISIKEIRERKKMKKHPIKTTANVPVLVQELYKPILQALQATQTQLS